ncbi:iron-containing alcohol dehydrogenase [Pyrococcus yayanosii]|uniref:Alchol dehydrogenase n=1 Tax=Pyrococcus yayanosii (strain CH1 / JCM 16557) TaxID=529709 RepID=F8AHE6_PYRYC|nr:iron-containing alcohol dehydrogenase [Pyrococcus yayanosii]AEH24143.1 alchol dehydrogenase [Pyrococcus yayanosii CH1]
MRGFFFLNTKVVLGRESLSYLEKALRGKERVLFLSSRSMRTHGFLKEAMDYAEEAGALVEAITSVPAEPTIDAVEELLPKVREFSPDALVAIGGGSVIDVAKAVKVFYDVPDVEFDKVAFFSRFQRPEPLPKLRTPLIAVPSTSGAGSEVSAATVIKKDGIKYTIVSPEITPDVAILDPRLPEKMPPEVAKNSGLDVLVHAIEAYVSKAATPFSDAMAIKAALTVFESLERSVKRDTEAREAMHYAATMAGIAFLNGRLGLVHAMSHKAAWMGPHGLLNAILLPYVMEFNMARARELYERLARELGLRDAGELLERVRELNEALSVPMLSELAEEDVFMERLDEMSRKAYEDPLVSFNPVEPKVDEIREIYLRAFRGE